MKRSTTNGSSIHWREINLSEIRRGYVMIIITIQELVMVRSNSVILIDSTEGSKHERDKNDESRLSGYVMLAVMQLDKTINKRGFVWGREHFDTVNSAEIIL